MNRFRAWGLSLALAAVAGAPAIAADPADPPVMARQPGQQTTVYDMLFGPRKPKPSATAAAARPAPITAPLAPEVVAAAIAPVLAAGKEAGLRLSILCAPTRDEALSRAEALVASVNRNGDVTATAERNFVHKTDSQSIQHAWKAAETEWLTPVLWTGAVRTHGAPSIALVGDPDQVADGLLEFGRLGISQFILSGWPKEEAMIFFGQEVIPRVRREEAGL